MFNVNSSASSMASCASAVDTFCLRSGEGAATFIGKEMAVSPFLDQL